ncbi:unnamed protein product [Cylicostephanus goldi]|uniref:Uncharacterized protein n=1 Tax=Cylicostephanus goldi TaxID=71465 RepID=A0A3P7Q8F5_CYLGO|nr:unnamed protein product [Cylicostephanus goldi]
MRPRKITVATTEWCKRPLISKCRVKRYRNKSFSSNLSFTASVPDLPLSFSIVGLPDHGVIECSPEHGHFAVCSTFTQDQVRKNCKTSKELISHFKNILVYHIEEPPKYGILSRRINGKSRRIGVSSNFTQLDIDNRLISFKLHFMQYSIINDFFLFRVITPAVSSESLRFEVGVKNVPLLQFYFLLFVVV